MPIGSRWWNGPGKPGWMFCSLPAIDRASYEAMFDFTRRYPGSYAMMGLHPTSVNDNPHWKTDLETVEHYLAAPPQGIRFVGVGEIGLDFYWESGVGLGTARGAAGADRMGVAIRFAGGVAYPGGLGRDVRFAGKLPWTWIARGAAQLLGTAEHYERMKRLGGFLFGVGGPGDL